MPGHSTFWRWIERIGAVGGVVALIVWLLSESVRNAVEDAACWLYPDWLIVLLGLAVLGMLAAYARHRRAGGQRFLVRIGPAPPEPPPDPIQQERDRRLVRDLIDTVPRRVITFLRNHDFGSPWRDDSLEPLIRYMHERDEVEWQFGDPEVEALRAKLMASARQFLGESAMRAGVDSRGQNSLKAWDETHRPGSWGEHEQRYRESRQVLNDGADAVADAYDELLVKAREKGLLD